MKDRTDHEDLFFLLINHTLGQTYYPKDSFLNGLIKCEISVNI